MRTAHATREGHPPNQSRVRARVVPVGFFFIFFRGRYGCRSVTAGASTTEARHSSQVLAPAAGKGPHRLVPSLLARLPPGRLRCHQAKVEKDWLHSPHCLVF